MCHKTTCEIHFISGVYGLIKVRVLGLDKVDPDPTLDLMPNLI